MITISKMRIHMSPKIPAKVFRRFFIVSSVSSLVFWVWLLCRWKGILDGGGGGSSERLPTLVVLDWELRRWFVVLWLSVESPIIAEPRLPILVIEPILPCDFNGGGGGGGPDGGGRSSTGLVTWLDIDPRDAVFTNIAWGRQHSCKKFHFIT